MTIKQIVESIHSGHGTPAVRAVIHLIESYATEATALAHSENTIKDGMADKYLMASGFLANILVDLREYAAGRMPAMPVQERLRPRRPDPQKS